MPWPSPEEQIAAAHAPPDSPLAQLIRENQDFDLLQPEEAHDESGLPPWIRVYWHKQHPEESGAGADPTGGYPMALDALYNWMLAHPSLQPEAQPESTPPPDEPDANSH